jgi:hypothetical protein
VTISGTGEMRWPKYFKKKYRKSKHYEDPVIVRTCTVCTRQHKWPLSETQGGKELLCSCGATFCSWRNPQWYHPG